MANVQEFSPTAETVTATMTLPAESGEHFGPPLSIGFYPGLSEIWIEGDCGHQCIPLQHLPDVIKQLRRAAKIAAENVEVDHD